MNLARQADRPFRHLQARKPCFQIRESNALAGTCCAGASHLTAVVGETRLASLAVAEFESKEPIASRLSMAESYYHFATKFQTSTVAGRMNETDANWAKLVRLSNVSRNEGLGLKYFIFILNLLSEERWFERP
jgi:hypothetical protein